jgi:5-formyltetrahydrofolate cyclo-ligase
VSHATESSSEHALPNSRDAKRALRTYVRNTVAELRPMARAHAARRAAELVLRAPPLVQAKLVLVYRALPDEIDTDPLITQLVTRGVCPVFPLVFDAPNIASGAQHSSALRALGLFAIRARDPLCSTMWRTDRYGIRAPNPDAPCVRRVQPREIDAVIVPGRAFDAVGNRLGRGKGFYDALLPKLRPDARAATIGFAYACQEFGEVPVETHDARVAWLVTEKRVIRCGITGRGMTGFGNPSTRVPAPADPTRGTPECADE